MERAIRELKEPALLSEPWQKSRLLEKRRSAHHQWGLLVRTLDMTGKLLEGHN